MDLVHPDVDRYLGDLAASGDPVLEEMEGIARDRGFPIVGPQVGQMLHVLAIAVGARRILELGSGFGYSAYWFSRAVGPEGRVILTEGSEDQALEARGYLERGGFADRVRIEVGDALEIAGGLDGEFDIVFNDVDKHDYGRVYDLALKLVRPGGLFITDNMLWRGQVLDDDADDPDTRGVKSLTRKLYESDEFATTLIPLRDGVTLAVRGGGGR
jgi:predicted O-methyltransferase YrrM